MNIDNFEFRNKQGNEIEPTKNQLVIYVKSLHKQIEELKTELNRYAELFGMKNKDFYVIEKAEYEKLKQDVKDIVNEENIKFAVEQLNQAIKNIKKLNYKDFGIIYQSDAIAVIDNQIEELKKELE